MTFLHFVARHKKSFIFGGILVLLILWGAWSMRPKPPTYEFVTAEKKNITQEVSVTGRVKPAEDVSLAFQIGGRVANSYVKIGDVVKTGDALADLYKADLRANLAQALARVEAETARLKQLREGTRPEEITLQEVRVTSAETAYLTAQKNVATAAADAYTKSDDMMRNKIDVFYQNPRTTAPDLTFATKDSTNQTFLENERAALTVMFSVWADENLSLAGSYDPATAASVRAHLLRLREFLSECSSVLQDAVANGNASQTTLDGYSSNVSSARATVNSALAALELSFDAVSSAKSALKVEQSALDLKKAPTQQETIAAQAAAVSQMRANVLSIEADIAKTVLRAPMDGIVTKQDAKDGEIVSPSVPVISIISKDALQIEAFVPEADIAKVKLGDTADVTLDAYGDSEKFTATVISIDPAETIIEGVATYKMIFRFGAESEKIKSGMTANVDIKTAFHEGALAVPQRVIIRKDDKAFVRIADGDSYREIEISSGLRGSDGNTEILSGLSEGQKIIVPKND